MDRDRRQELEDTLRSHCGSQRWDEATKLAIEGYGHEIFGYLSAAASSETDAEDAYATFCEALWRGLPRFRFASSVRTWAYVLARHALADARQPRRRGALLHDDLHAHADEERSHATP
jgi:RNA polymerase sigma-70 factor, ECF subfamily